MQQLMLISRFTRYIKCLRHLLNTGQGVVMHRSIYSDIAFAQTCVELGWISRAAFKYLEEMKFDGMGDFLRPHVVLYLDMDPQTIIDNVSKRDEPGEKNSPFYTPEVL